MKTTLRSANKIGTVNDRDFNSVKAAFEFMKEHAGVLENELEIYAHDSDEMLMDNPSDATCAKVLRAISIEGECDVYCTNRITHPHPLYSFLELA